MKFIVDNQLPPSLARFISDELKTTAIHVADIGLKSASDSALWEYASNHDLIVISKDEDFATMILNTPTAKLIWVRLGNCRKTLLLETFRRMWPRVIHRLESGDSLIEIR